jgi:glycosyltransferase involved in cell wall biosynthesis
MESPITRSARLLLPMLRKAFSRQPTVSLYEKTIAVDLTPPLPANGSEPATIVPLLRALSEQQPRWRWMLLTTPATHEQYASLESFNVYRQCVAAHKPELKAPLTLPRLPQTRWRKAARAVLALVGLPRPPHLLSTETVLKHLKADLLFCPFAATHICDPNVPTVAFWNNLSHLRHPQLLRPHEKSAAEHAFNETVRIADRVVCFSEDTRRAVLDASGVDAHRVIAARAELIQRLPPPPRLAGAAALERLGLCAGQFLYYPATFSAPNNHKLLLVAFGMWCRSQPKHPCKLVCNGLPESAAVELEKASRQMALAGQVVFCTTACPEEAAAALLRHCRAVIFPWLEGSRLQPVLQAVELGKPIFWSDQACLPDFLREAVELFDSRKPASLVQALDRAANDTALLASLAQRSYRQARTLGGPREAARRVLGIFQEALGRSRCFTDALKGMHPDGWTTERLVVMFASSTEPRTLRLTLQAPKWLPWNHQRIYLLRNRSIAGQTYKLKRGQTLTIECALPEDGGTMEFLFDPPLVPKALGMNNDERMLGAKCCECVLTGTCAQVCLFSAQAAAA